MKSTAIYVFILSLLCATHVSSADQGHGSLSCPLSDTKPAKMTTMNDLPVIDSGVHLESVVRRVYLMGTFCTLQLYTPDSKTALEQVESLVRILEKAERELSTWSEASILSRLNRQPVGVPFEIAPSFCQLFQILQFWSEETANTFDPTVGKLLEAYGVKNGGKWPDPDSIAIAKKYMGMKFYSCNTSRHRIIKRHDISIDSGAFGKGEALDRLLQAMTANTAWLVDFGGQVLVHGVPPGKSGWQVTIAHPIHRQEALFSIQLEYGSLATSGGSERDVRVENRRLGHIINPNTGLPAELNGSVTVWHNQALIADILSTALYVMGPEKGLLWADSRNIAACFLKLDERGKIEILSSHAFTRQFLNK